MGGAPSFGATLLNGMCVALCVQNETALKYPKVVDDLYIDAISLCDHGRMVNILTSWASCKADAAIALDEKLLWFSSAISEEMCFIIQHSFDFFIYLGTPEVMRNVVIAKECNKHTIYSLSSYVSGPSRQQL